MDIFDALTMIGGLSLFLFGMNVMGQALERRAGEKIPLRSRKIYHGTGKGNFNGTRSHSGYTKLVGGDRYGGGFRKLRTDEFKAGNKCYNGGECWYHRYRLGIEPFGN